MASQQVVSRTISRVSHSLSRQSSMKKSAGPISSHVCKRFISQSSHPSSSSSSSSSSSTTDRSADINPSKDSAPQPDLHPIFASPTWSVRSLLPASAASNTTIQEITPKTLHHLLRLSALPPPTSAEEESAMLQTLHTQLHFVRDIQSVDTTDVPPLRAIRDETSEGLAENTVTLETVREALSAEDVVGFRRRPRRRKIEGERSKEEELVESATAARREKGYFVVESGRAKGGE